MAARPGAAAVAARHRAAARLAGPARAGRRAALGRRPGPRAVACAAGPQQTEDLFAARERAGSAGARAAIVRQASAATAPPSDTPAAATAVPGAARRSIRRPRPVVAPVQAQPIAATPAAPPPPPVVSKAAAALVSAVAPGRLAARRTGGLSRTRSRASARPSAAPAADTRKRQAGGGASLGAMAPSPAGRPARAVRAIALGLALLVIAGCGQLLGTEPPATPTDFPGLTGRLKVAGITLADWVSGDAGLHRSRPRPRLDQHHGDRARPGDAREAVPLRVPQPRRVGAASRLDRAVRAVVGHRPARRTRSSRSRPTSSPARARGHPSSRPRCAPSWPRRRAPAADRAADAQPPDCPDPGGS